MKHKWIIVDFDDRSQYEKIISSCQMFLEFVIAYLLSIGFQLLHSSNCVGGCCLTRHSHYMRVKCGNITIWRIQCKLCKAVFTVIPSFLMPYRAYDPETVKKALIAYHGGLSFENCAIIFNISGLALYRIICALGRYSLPQMLTKVGVPLPNHIWVDEKHTQCLDQKGYIPIVSSGHAIWHIDYIEDTEQTTLETSYQTFQVESNQIDADYVPQTITHDGYRPLIAALRNIFPRGTVFILCWLHAIWSAGKVVASFSKSLGLTISWQLLTMLKECHSKVSLQNISLRSRLFGMVRHYRRILPATVWQALKDWVTRKRAYFYSSMDYSASLSFSYPIDHICNHLDRKLFMMKDFHHPNARKDLFIKGFGLIHNFIPYQRFARNSFLSPAQVEQAVLPHSDWFISLLILTSDGYHRN